MWQAVEARLSAAGQLVVNIDPPRAAPAHRLHRDHRWRHSAHGPRGEPCVRQRCVPVPQQAVAARGVKAPCKACQRGVPPAAKAVQQR